MAMPFWSETKSGVTIYLVFPAFPLDLSVLVLQQAFGGLWLCECLPGNIVRFDQVLIIALLLLGWGNLVLVAFTNVQHHYLMQTCHSF